MLYLNTLTIINIALINGKIVLPLTMMQLQCPLKLQKSSSVLLDSSERSSFFHFVRIFFFFFLTTMKRIKLLKLQFRESSDLKTLQNVKSMPHGCVKAYTFATCHFSFIF